MLEFLTEIIVVIFLGMIGAFIRWAFTGFKKGGFDRYYKQDTGQNAFLSILFIGMIAALVQLVKS